MKLANILLAASLMAGAASASEYVNYKGLTKQLKDEAKKNGQIATTADVKAALASKDWAVVDVRTMEEWQAARIEGSTRIGRQSPEKALDAVVLNDEDKFVKNNLIVVCNTASRAAIEAEAFRKMGFKEVKIYPLVSWIDECNPVVNMYSSHENKHGTKHKFGKMYAEHCKK